MTYHLPQQLRIITFLSLLTTAFLSASAYAEVVELDAASLDETYVKGVAISLAPKQKEADDTEGQEIAETAGKRDEERYSARMLHTTPVVKVKTEPRLLHEAVSLDGKAVLSQTGDMLQIQFLNNGQPNLQNFSSGENVFIQQQGGIATLLLSNTQ